MELRKLRLFTQTNMKKEETKMKRVVSIVLSALMMFSCVTAVCGAGNRGIFEAYKSVIDEYNMGISSAETNVFEDVYSVYDIDKDGIPELIVDNNEPHATREVYIYTFNNGLVYLGSCRMGYAELCQYPDGEGFAGFNAYKNRQFLELITYNGSGFDSQMLTESKEVYSIDDIEEPEDMIPGAYRLEQCPIGSSELLEKALAGFSAGGAEEPAISVVLNGSALTFDQPPIIEHDRTMVPIRAIFEALGYTLDWNGETQTATATNGSNTITVTVGENIITYSGGTYECDVPPINRNGRILVPVRAIAECAGCDVDWDGDTRTVIINEKSEESARYTAEELSALDDFIGWLDKYRANKSWTSSEYDCENPFSEDRSIFDNIVNNPRCADLEIYPFDAPVDNWQGNKSDPKRRFDSYTKISKDEVFWVLENIFNCSADDVARMEKARLDSDENIYLYDGYYYMFLGGAGWENTTQITNIDYNGEYCYVTYDSIAPMSNPEHYYAVVSLKEINGGKYWSLYKHSKDMLIFNN